METITYNVPNISCMHCVHTIKNELGEIAGVETVDANAETKMVKVTFEAPATPETIEKALAEINYPVVK